MMTTIDTNILVRSIMADNSKQAELASHVMQVADVAVSLITFCETAWVLRSSYRKSRKEIALALERVQAAPNVKCNRKAVHFGIAALERGGDFADAVIALEGERIGGETFLSFDRKAVRVLAFLGLQARLLD